MNNIPKFAGLSRKETCTTLFHACHALTNLLDMERLEKSKSWREELGRQLRQQELRKKAKCDDLVLYANRIEFNTDETILLKAERPQGYESIHTWGEKSSFVTQTEAKRHTIVWADKNPNKIVLFVGGSYETPFVPDSLIRETEDAFKKYELRGWEHVPASPVLDESKKELLYMKIEDVISGLTHEQLETLHNKWIVRVYQLLSPPEVLWEFTSRLLIVLGLTRTMFSKRDIIAIEAEFLRRVVGDVYKNHTEDAQKLELLLTPLSEVRGYEEFTQKGISPYRYEYVFELIEKMPDEIEKITGTLFFRSFRNFCRDRIVIGEILSREIRTHCWMKKVRVF